MIQVQGNDGEYQGDETFVDGYRSLPFTMLDFWRWSSSSLLDNTMRGLLAEYLVAKAIGAQENVRHEWSRWDLTTPSGIKIEVKSAAYVQNWHQRQPSAIRFGIQPTRGWDAASGKYEHESKRQADYYIFCLFTAVEKNAANPLQLKQWVFYVLATETVNACCKDQQTLGLSRLITLKAQEHTWHSLRGLKF